MEEPIQKIADLTAKHPSGRREHVENCSDCKRRGYLQKYFQNEYETLVRDALDELLYLTADKIILYYDHLEIYYNIINSKIKLHGQVNYGVPVIPVNLNLEEEKIKYAEKKGIPIRSLISEMEAIANPFNQAGPESEILMLRPENMGPRTEE